MLELKPQKYKSVKQSDSTTGFSKKVPGFSQKTEIGEEKAEAGVNLEELYLMCVDPQS